MPNKDRFAMIQYPLSYFGKSAIRGVTPPQIEVGNPTFPTHAMIFLRLLLFGALHWGVSIAVLAQDEGEQNTDYPINATSERASIASAESLLEGAGEVSEQDRTGSLVKGLYQKSIELLYAEQRALEESDKYQRILQTAADEEARLTAELDQLEAIPSPSPEELSEWRQFSQGELEHGLAESEAEVVELRARLAGKQSELAQLRARPQNLRNDLLVANKRLQELLKEIPTEPAKDAIGRARSFHSQSERQQLSAQIRLLSLEDVSATERLTLLSLQIKLLEKRIATIARSIRAIYELIDARLLEKGAEARARAQEIRRQAVDKHVLVQQVAARNAKLSEELAAKNIAIEQINTRLLELGELSRKIEREHQRTIREVDLGASSSAIGQFLHRQRNDLANMVFSEAYSQRPGALRHQLRKAQSRQFAVEDELLKLRRGEITASSLIEEFNVENPEGRTLVGVDRISLRADIEELLKNRIGLLGQVFDRSEEMVKELQDLRQELYLLHEKGRSYARMLSDQQWLVPSNPAISVAWASALVDSIKTMLSPGLWIKGGEVLLDAWREVPLVGLFVLFLVGVLISQRRRLKQVLKAIAEEIGRFYSDRFSLTVRALGVTALLALPLPLLVLGLHWMLSTASGISVRTFVGHELAVLAFQMFGVQILHSLFIQNGVAESHLRLRGETLANTRYNLAWWIPAFIVGITLIAMTRFHGGPTQFYDTISLLVFVIVAIATAVFLWRTLQPSSAEGSGDARQNRAPRKLWVTLLCLVFLVSAAIALAGYYYTASSLISLVVNTTWLIGGGVLAYQLALRWQKLANSKLARARAWISYEASRKEKADREAAGAAGEVLPERQTRKEMDLEDVDTRIKRLLKTLLILITGIGVVWLWHQYFPIAGLLDSVELWQRISVTDDGQQVASVTLKHLLMALLIAALSATVARNLPALLELLLDPFKLDSGNRYAVTRILVYLVYVGGFVLLMGVVGISWNDLQWLVAAMGVGLGFGLKEIFANLISGLILLFERPIRVGDWVTTQEVSGVVTRIRVRATTITDWDNKELIIPNQSLIIEPVVNWTLTDQITRITFPVGIAYGSNTEMALQVMMDTVKACDLVMEEPPPRIFFLEFGDSSLNFEVRAFVQDRLNRMPAIHELHMNLDNALREAGIEIPFPQRDLHVRSVDKNISLTTPEAAGN